MRSNLTGLSILYKIKKQTSADVCFAMVRVKGLEPIHLSALDPKSSTSANSVTPACYENYSVMMVCCQSELKEYKSIYLIPTGIHI